MIGRDASKDVIKGGATHLTSGSAVAAAIVALVTGIGPVWEFVFDESEPSQAVRAAVVIAVIAAWAVVASADLMARAWVSSRTRAQIAPAPAGLQATNLGAGGTKGWTVAAIRHRPTKPGEPEFLVVKEDMDATWATADKLRFDAPAK